MPPVKLENSSLRRRFGAWLDVSIVNRLTFVAVVLTMSVVVSIGLVASTISYLQIQNSIAQELEAEAVLTEEFFRTSLQLLSRDMASLAGNPLVGNALVDSQGRETYLVPFLRNYRSPLNVRLSLALHDFRGGAVAGTNPGAQTSLENAPWLETLITDGKSHAEILRGESTSILRFAYPVLYPATGLAEGVLIGEINLDDLYHEAIGRFSGRFKKHLLAGDGQHLGYHGSTDENKSIVLYKTIKLEDPLKALGMKVEVSSHRAETLRPLYLMVSIFFVVGGLILLGVILLTRRVVRRLAQPLLELSDAAESIATSNLLAAKVDVQGRDEIGKLAQSFNTMIDSLNNAYQFLELRVQERTHSLRVTETELRAQQRDYLLIFDAVRAAVAYLDCDGRIVRANHRACEQIGRAPADIIGKTVLELFPPELAEQAHRDNLATLQVGEAKYDLLQRAPVGNGEMHWFLVDRIPSFDESEKVSGLTVFMMDIDDRVNMEAQLKQLNETLEQRIHEEVAKNREKDHLMIQQSRLAGMGEMIGNIAHQWRQPLNTLGLILENIKDSYQYNELTGEYLEGATDKGQKLIQKMSTTIDDFRNFFRPNRTPQNFSLQKSVEDALELVEASFRNNDIAIDIKVKQDALVRGFPSEYSQVLLNLLNNAKDAILSRQIKPGRVGIEVGVAGDDGYVLVNDNGGGIPEDVREKIFDPYFTTREKGTGIGLYMSKMIVENNMNGRIEVRNAEQGAEFRVVAPLWRGDESPASLRVKTP